MTAHEFVVVAAQAVAEAEPSSPESKQSAGDGGSGIGGKTRLLDLDAKPPSVYSRAISSASIFVLVAFVLSMYLIVEHLAAYDQPEEQKLLIGLILMVPVYALESFLSLLDSNAAFNCQIIRDYSAMLLRHCIISLSTISSFYTEHQKGPFSNQPWDSGSLRFKFMLGGSPPSPWEDFQSNRNILAVIGLCHCPSSPNLDAVVDQFAAVCKGYSSALVQCCFGFCPGDSQLENGNKRASTEDYR